MTDLKYRVGSALFNYLTCVPNGGTRVIVSTYNNHEWINTYHTPSVWLLKLSYRLKGIDATFELFDPTKDQVTFHTPYMNL
tara:strand:- start:481 stop:723 length:243 start_codon:yes stop_codon:yes gene_type:complete